MADMKLADIRIFRFRLPLRHLLYLKGRAVGFRDGFAVRLIDDNDHIGWGEVAPLPGFSRENTDTALNQLTALRKQLSGKPVPESLERLESGFEKWLSTFNLAASVRFGIESAVLNLMAASKKISLPHLLGSQTDAVSVNGLLAGPRDEVIRKARLLLKNGYRNFKLKVGGDVDSALALTAQVRQIIGETSGLRLDANRAWSISHALQFISGAAKLNIDYLEEPVINLDQLRSLVFRSAPQVPIALDESLLELKPQDLSSPYNIKAVVIKPTLLGLEKAAGFARAARENKITPVISSSFESSLGIYTLASMAGAVVAGDIACGLDTLDWLEHDLCDQPVTIQSGRIELEQHRDTPQTVRLPLLEEITGE